MALYFGSSPKQKIDMLLYGNGVEYTNIIYNNDDTITLIDKKGNEHTMVCSYEDDKLVGIAYDGIGTRLTYEDDALIKIGKTGINVENAPSIDTSGTGGTTMTADASVVSIILPIQIPTISVDMSNNIIADASARLEE